VTLFFKFILGPIVALLIEIALVGAIYLIVRRYGHLVVAWLGVVEVDGGRDYEENEE